MSNIKYVVDTNRLFAYIAYSKKTGYELCRPNITGEMSREWARLATRSLIHLLPGKAPDVISAWLVSGEEGVRSAAHRESREMAAHISSRERDNFSFWQQHGYNPSTLVLRAASEASSDNPADVLCAIVEIRKALSILQNDPEYLNDINDRIVFREHAKSLTDKERQELWRDLRHSGEDELAEIVLAQCGKNHKEKGEKNEEN